MRDGPPGDAEILLRLAPPVAAWCRASLPSFTEAQRRALPRVLADESLLLSSPTGTGKTLAGFLGVLSRLHAMAAGGPLAEGAYCLYVSPLKALVHDVSRNLRAPMEGMQAFAPPDAAPLRAALRTGDTPPSERQRQARAPPHVLATTPESLALLLASPSWGPHFRTLRWVVVDEVHALAGTKRGAHLALLLEMLEEAAGRPLVRVGLSATVSPLDAVARWLTGGRPCRVEAVPPGEPADLRVAMPVPSPRAAREEALERATLDLLEGIVRAHETTLVFANTRALAERVAMQLHERLGEAAEVEDEDEGASHDPEFPAPEEAPPVAPHHGSMSRESRLVVEERLKRRELRCVVSSSSLELGIDVASVGHVVLLGSPKGVARALQRVGRADHRVGGRSRGTLVAQDPGELAEAFALVDLARRRAVEDVAVPPAPADVLLQGLVGMALLRPRTREEALALARRAAPWRDLTREDLDALLAAPHPLLDPDPNEIRVRHGGARMTYLTHAGTIPEGGALKVLHGNVFVGEVEEAFIETLQEGDVLRLAGRSWRYVGAHGRRVRVIPAAFAPPTVPDWRGEGVSASPLLATHAEQYANGILSHASSVTGGSEESVRAFEAFRGLQAAFSGLPPPDAFAVESFLHEDGGRAHVVHAWLGRRANEALARTVAWRARVDARTVAADAGFALMGPRTFRPAPATWRRLLKPPLADDLRAALEGTELARRRFRHVATRSLLLPRREDEPLAMRQRQADALATRLDPTHPILHEAWREVLHDALDLDLAERAAQTRAVVLLPDRPCATPYAARILYRASSPEGREAIRDHEERMRDWLSEQGISSGF